MFVTLRKNHSTMKHLSVFIFWGVPGSHVLVIRGRWFMTSRALAVLGLKELPAKIRRKRNLFRAAQTQTWNMWTFKCVYNPPNKFPISWFLFLFLLGGSHDIFDLQYRFCRVNTPWLWKGRLRKAFRRGWGFGMTSEMSWIPSIFGKKAGKPGPFSSCAGHSGAEPRDRIMHQDTVDPFGYMLASYRQKYSLSLGEVLIGEI